jgi:UDP-glucose 4-epimerase
MLIDLEKTRNKVEIYNIGSQDQTNVKTIAETVIKEMRIKNVQLKFIGGVDGGRGWKGDVKNMLLDISKIKSLGWKPKHNSRQAIRKAAKQAITNLKVS